MGHVVLSALHSRERGASEGSSLQGMAHSRSWAQQLLSHRLVFPAPEVQQALLTSATLLPTLHVTLQEQGRAIVLLMVLHFKC